MTPARNPRLSARTMIGSISSDMEPPYGSLNAGIRDSAMASATHKAVSTMIRTRLFLIDCSLSCGREPRRRKGSKRVRMSALGTGIRVASAALPAPSFRSRRVRRLSAAFAAPDTVSRLTSLRSDHVSGHHAECSTDKQPRCHSQLRRYGYGSTADPPLGWVSKCRCGAPPAALPVLPTRAMSWPALTCPPVTTYESRCA